MLLRVFRKSQKFSSSLSKSFFRTSVVHKSKTAPTDFALNHFDQFYGSVLENWPSIRLALLCPHNYCCVVNTFAKEKSPYELFGDMEVRNLRDEYLLQIGDPENISTFSKPDESKSPTEKIISQAAVYEKSVTSLAVTHEECEFMPATEFRQRDLDFDDYSDIFNPAIDYHAQIVKHGVIHYPEYWEFYYCPRGKFKKFPAPKIDETELLNYYLMDGASVLPVFALDVQKNDEVGDLCASPGGKTLAILFSLRFGKLVCNDVSLSRLNKLKAVLSTYIPSTQEWSKKILISNLDVRDWQCFGAFDKILLDVPCTNDRLSVMKNENNIFSPKRFQERMQIPRVQTSMLSTALQALKQGGSLVYSTCSLSPIQNDGVVHMALSRLSTETNLEFAVQDLTEAFLPFRNVFKFSEQCQYGQLVLPFLPLNYGPMYIAKITRTK